MKDEEDGGREVVERHAERDCPLSLISSSFILHPSSFILHPFSAFILFFLPCLILLSD